MNEDETLVKFRDLAVEAADALWALEKGKNPTRSPKDINQAIHAIRPAVDAILEKRK